MARHFEWHPARILQEQQRAGWKPLTIVMLNQPIRDVSTLRKLWGNATIKVAADGGANHLLAVGHGLFDNVDVIIGDLDSFTDESRAYYQALPRPPAIIQDPDQESTDFGKAVKLIRDRDRAPEVAEAISHIQFPQEPCDIVAVGGLGGRIDQGLSQLHHLCLFQADEEYQDGRMYLVSSENLTFLLKPGRHIIHVREDAAEESFGKHVGIIPIKGRSIITTKGLQWDVENWETEYGGRISTSNHVRPETRVVEVVTDKDVVFTIELLHRGVA
ncbi:hypothetical protein MAPG_01329 [Magnaporthiopsis poae ATCC 64411]|uniref:Thiamine pyrophosphokinase n=1 Tax=Magnaporthiopsis poae (strain ATCC 64411 / 73-15) TaxID=644358 RepID=A0A0C4DNE8_MAGP6|nr:hypothetical protein MAPG_01329 [Magnaporthiopsis poae ATCC 64411]